MKKIYVIVNTEDKKLFDMAFLKEEDAKLYCNIKNDALTNHENSYEYKVLNCLGNFLDATKLNEEGKDMPSAKALQKALIAAIFQLKHRKYNFTTISKNGEKHTSGKNFEELSKIMHTCVDDYKKNNGADLDANKKIVNDKYSQSLSVEYINYCAKYKEINRKIETYEKKLKEVEFVINLYKENANQESLEK